MNETKSLSAGILFCLGVGAHAEHPVVLVSAADRPAMQSKLRDVDWARAAYAKLRDRLIPYVKRHGTDPEWITSRMLMNWDTHYITPIVESDKWVRGEGRAPVPTPRYAGQRDWSGEYGLPDIGALKPYNDRNGMIWARNGKGEYAWVHPSKTAHSIESRNRSFMALAKDAAFVYWLTGDEAYATFATDIFWPYVHGFSFKKMPHGPNGKRVGEEGGPRHIYGSQTFEVIHDNIVKDIALTYDFLHNHLVAQGKDVRLVQHQLKRMADRVIEGGGRGGNWNLHQADIIAHAGLALEENDAYEDGKGWEHYTEVVLEADLPHQLGLNQVLRTGYDQETGIWPEAFGYGTGVTVSITRIASLIARRQRGTSVLDDPILTKASLVQFQWLFPHGRSIGLGDTTHGLVPTAPLELLVSYYRRNGQDTRERTLTGALRQEIAGGRYDRGSGAGLLEICLYVPDLKEADDGPGFVLERVFHGKPLNALIQRNLVDDPQHSLMAVLHGTRGGHTHANGLNLELFGAGEVVGPDPGPGSSYWQQDHARYYKQRPAHNTVIIKGQDRGASTMEVVTVEPQPGDPGVSPHFGFADTRMDGGRPPARQRRCLALVRTSQTTGFYLDVFRSHTDSPEPQAHDYLYHNIGQTLQLLDPSGQPLALSESNELGSEHADPEGYDYFESERSGIYADTFRAVFEATFPKRVVSNAAWIAGAPNRRVYTLSSPRIIRANRGELPKSIAGLPIPVLLIRQEQQAWAEPFVVVFDPFDGSRGPSVTAVHRIATTNGSAVGVLVECTTPAPTGPQACTVALVHDDIAQRGQEIPGGHFHGQFGATMLREGELVELYLGQGQAISHGRNRLEGRAGQEVRASLRRMADGWYYAGTAPLRVQLATATGGAGADPTTLRLYRQTPDGVRTPVNALVAGAEDGKKVAQITAELPAGEGLLIIEQD